MRPTGTRRDSDTTHSGQPCVDLRSVDGSTRSGRLTTDPRTPTNNSDTIHGTRRDAF
ncbi:hypothetical protein PLICRDRAFT_39589 [Plicaturopsis crispa FD-325 SS-3]|nr:hypothetical protein PLICRDRAFT_39589 [Plicaturopsis crispa FD-325 SS-3]